MTAIELAGQDMNGNLGMLMMHFGDMTDADMLVRPVPGANHIAWQLGHLIGAESGMINMVTPGASPLPDGFAAKFTKETSKSDDAKMFPKKAEILDQFNKTRLATIAWTQKLTEADLGKPGPEPVRSMCPTVGNLLSLLQTHTAMHMGQVQVIRRKLGKPILF